MGNAGMRTVGKGERRKFYMPDAVSRMPVYLDEQVQTYLAAKACNSRPNQREQEQ